MTGTASHLKSSPIENWYFVSLLCQNGGFKMVSRPTNAFGLAICLAKCHPQLFTIYQILPLCQVSNLQRFIFFKENNKVHRN